jgi:hypothetical protein
MPPYRKVLFPLDYSIPCEAVLPYGREMERSSQRRVGGIKMTRATPL